MNLYNDLVQTASLNTSPRAAWLLLRVGEHPGDTPRMLAGRLRIGVDDLDARLAELVSAGYLQEPTGDGVPLSLTGEGHVAYGRLFTARQERIERFLDGWDPQDHPELLRVLNRFTLELAASSERPGPDLEPATPAR